MVEGLRPMKDAQALGSFRGAFNDKYNLNTSLTENATDEKIE